MPRNKKENGDREFIPIRIFYNDHKLLESMCSKGQSFAEVIHYILTKVDYDDLVNNKVEKDLEIDNG